MRKLSKAILFSSLIATTASYATDAASCKTVRFADVGWTDITAFWATGCRPWKVILKNIAKPVQWKR